jgi:hypothetical protein
VYNNSHEAFPLGLALTFILILAAAIQGNVQAQSFERNFQNGYSVRGAFLEFYENAPDPLLLFGYPISSEISRATEPCISIFNMLALIW